MDRSRTVKLSNSLHNRAANPTVVRDQYFSRQFFQSALALYRMITFASQNACV